MKDILQNEQYKKYLEKNNNKSTYIPPYLRRKGVRDVKQRGKIDDIVYGAGPMGFIIISLMDKVIDIIYALAKPFGELFWMGLNEGEDIMLGGFKGIFGDSVEKHGLCVTFQLFRYLITIITPPIGVFMAKGVSGWVPFLISAMLCYFNYLIGIIYSIVVAVNSKYGDLYEKYQYEKIIKIQSEIPMDVKDKSKRDLYFLGGVFFIVFGVVLIYYVIKTLYSGFILS